MSLNGPVNDSKQDPDQPDSPQGLILVVDDNTHIQRLMVSLLRMHGRRAVSAASMEEAILVCQSQSSEITVAIVDCSLCFGDQIGILNKLRILIPQLKIILTSGMLEEDCCPEQADPPYDLFLPKPFNPANLMKALQQVVPVNRS